MDVSNGCRMRPHAGLSPPAFHDRLPGARPSRPFLPDRVASSSLQLHDGLLKPTHASIEHLFESRKSRLHTSSLMTEMATDRITVTIDEDVLAELRAHDGPVGFLPTSSRRFELAGYSPSRPLDESTACLAGQLPGRVGRAAEPLEANAICRGTDRSAASRTIFSTTTRTWGFTCTGYSSPLTAQRRSTT